ncbi:MAG: restriction endonuclease [Ruminococcus sp.]|nr:restriction endonuclease [Ruminococcus sp.]
MTGYEFEEFCHALLLKNGYDSVEITPSSRDQGIDLIAYKDDVKYGIQCKCYSDDVGNKAVQEAIAGKTFYKCHIGVVLTNRYFTRSARELAESSGILLWDRDRMLKMIFHAK